MASDRANKWLGALGTSTQVDDPAAQAAIDQFEKSAKTGQAFAQVFDQFLITLTESYQTDEAALAEKENTFLQHEKSSVQQYYQDIVSFLGSANPGPIQEVAKQVLRDRPSLLTKLEIRMPSLNRAVLIHIGHILPENEAPIEEQSDDGAQQNSQMPIKGEG